MLAGMEFLGASEVAFDVVGIVRTLLEGGIVEAVGTRTATVESIDQIPGIEEIDPFAARIASVRQTFDEVERGLVVEVYWDQTDTSIARVPLVETTVDDAGDASTTPVEVHTVLAVSRDREEKAVGAVGVVVVGMGSVRARPVRAGMVVHCSHRPEPPGFR
jgi:hypothetical protein